MENQIPSLSLPNGGHAIEKVGTLATPSKSTSNVGKQGATTFTCFKSLPAEMRNKIWEDAAIAPRVVVIELAGCGAGHFRFCKVFNNLDSLPKTLQVCVESRNMAQRKLQPAFASSFQHLNPSCYEAETCVDPYESHSDESDSDDPEYRPYRTSVFDFQPTVSFTETDCLYLRYYLFDYDNPTPTSFLPANLKPRTFHRVALEIDLIEEKFFQFIKCFIWTFQIDEIIVVALSEFGDLHFRADDLHLLELDEDERDLEEANEKKDLLQKLLSEWERPSAEQVKKALGGSMEVMKKKDFTMPKIKIMGIAEGNIRI
jgi:hypothetical protein